jgi:hypothetical protein
MPQLQQFSANNYQIHSYFTPFKKAVSSRTELKWSAWKLTEVNWNQSKLINGSIGSKEVEID